MDDEIIIYLLQKCFLSFTENHTEKCMGYYMLKLYHKMFRFIATLLPFDTVS